MPLFGDLKKLFFGAKSVAKNQANRAREAAGELGDELQDKATNLADDARDLARNVVDKAPGVIQDGREALDDLSAKLWRDADDATPDKATASESDTFASLRPEEEPTLDLDDLTARELPSHDAPKSGTIDFEADLVEDPASSIRQAGEGLKNAASSAFERTKDATAGARAAASDGLDSAARLGNTLKDKTADMAEKVGGQVLEKGDDLLNRAAEMGAGLKEKADAYLDHASEQAAKIRAEEAAEEARIAAEVAKARERAFDGKEANRDTAESTLSGTGSFFDRAERFADGDYHNEGGKDIRLLDADADTPKDSRGTITGFTDADGDGDALIDDAEIVGEEE